MAQFCIICFNGVSLRFALRDFITIVMVPKLGIRIKGITEIPFGFWPIIYNGLKIISSAFPDDLPTQDTASGSVDFGQEVDSVILLQIKVKSSSSSVFFNLLWYRCGRQALCMGFGPISYALRIHSQLTSDLPQVRAIHIKLNCLLANFRTVTAGFFDRSIFAATQIAPIPLTAR